MLLRIVICYRRLFLTILDLFAVSATNFAFRFLFVIGNIGLSDTYVVHHK